MPEDIQVKSLLGGAEEELDVLRAESRNRGWFRLEYAILAGLAVLFAAYGVAFFALGLDLEGLRQWGYVGIFFIAMAGSATFVMPTPSNVAIFGSAIVLDPIMGIPAPILIGVVAGLGDAVGEFSGYALGYAGRDVLRKRSFFLRFEGWMRQRGMLTIFLLSTFPNPFFDLIGAAAGSTRMPLRRFFLATFAGKTIKNLFLALGGTFSAALVRGLL